MSNILNFPATTLYGRNVPKTAFVSRAPNGQRATLHRWLTDDFDTITWLYKLTAETLNVGEGKEVQEIDVFLCQMKGDGYNAAPFTTMDKLMPRHTIYLIRCGESLDILMHHKAKATVRGETVWRCGETEILRHAASNTSTTLRIEGQTMDAVYYSLLSQVSAMPVRNQTEYGRKAEIRRQLRQIEKQIVTLQRRIRKERQFNLQVEMNGEVRRLRRHAEAMSQQLNN